MSSEQEILNLNKVKIDKPNLENINKILNNGNKHYKKIKPK